MNDIPSSVHSRVEYHLQRKAVDQSASMKLDLANLTTDLMSLSPSLSKKYDIIQNNASCCWIKHCIRNSQLMQLKTNHKSDQLIQIGRTAKEWYVITIVWSTANHAAVLWHVINNQSYCSIMTCDQQPIMLQYCDMWSTTNHAAVLWHVINNQSCCSIVTCDQQPIMLQYCDMWSTTNHAAVLWHVINNQSCCSIVTCDQQPIMLQYCDLWFCYLFHINPCGIANCTWYLVSSWLCDVSSHQFFKLGRHVEQFRSTRLLLYALLVGQFVHRQPTLFYELLKYQEINQ